MGDPNCRRCGVRYQSSRLHGVCDLCELDEIAALKNMTRDDLAAAMGSPLAANAWQPEKEAELQRFREREPLVQALLLGLEKAWDDAPYEAGGTAELFGLHAAVADFKVMP